MGREVEVEVEEIKEGESSLVKMRRLTEMPTTANNTSGSGRERMKQ